MKTYNKKKTLRLRNIGASLMLIGGLAMLPVFVTTNIRIWMLLLTVYTILSITGFIMICVANMRIRAKIINSITNEDIL